MACGIVNLTAGRASEERNRFYFEKVLAINWNFVPNSSKIAERIEWIGEDSFYSLCYFIKKWRINMKMIHRNCGGIVKESDTIPNYVSEDCGTVPAYECISCSTEILGDSQIQFIPENIIDKIQIESMFNYESSPS